LITIYGSRMNRASRCAWMCEELGLEYKIEAPSDMAAYAAINPNAKVPAMVDGETILFESMAINLYLVRKYGEGKLPDAGFDGFGRLAQWTLWCVTELEGPLVDILIQRRFSKEPNEAVIAAAEKALPRPLAVLEQALTATPYLAGDEFGAADLNVAAVVLVTSLVNFDLSPWPHVKAWYERCASRPAMKRARS